MAPARNSMTPPATPLEHFGHATKSFRSLRKLGEGGFGSALEVDWKEGRNGLWSRAVLKRVDMTSLDCDWSRKQAMAEAALMKATAHPFIVGCCDSWIYQDVMYLHLDWCSKGDLHALFMKNGRLTADELADMTVHSLLALKFLHARGVIHRDIKPANILRTAGGKTMLTDFNCASIAGSDVLAAGTPGYVSPEMTAGKPYSTATDIWSLGITLVEVATKQTQITGDTPEEIDAQVLAYRMPKLTAFSAELNQVMSRMLIQDPARRATASQLLKSPCLAKALARSRKHFKMTPAVLDVAALVIPAPPAINVAATQTPSDTCPYRLRPIKAVPPPAVAAPVSAAVKTQSGPKTGRTTVSEDDLEEGDLCSYDLRGALRQQRLKVGQQGRQCPPAAVPATAGRRSSVPDVVGQTDQSGATLLTPGSQTSGSVSPVSSLASTTPASDTSGSSSPSTGAGHCSPVPSLLLPGARVDTAQHVSLRPPTTPALCPSIAKTLPGLQAAHQALEEGEGCDQGLTAVARDVCAPAVLLPPGSGVSCGAKATSVAPALQQGELLAEEEENDDDEWFLPLPPAASPLMQQALAGLLATGSSSSSSRTGTAGPPASVYGGDSGVVQPLVLGTCQLSSSPATPCKLSVQSRDASDSASMMQAPVSKATATARTSNTHSIAAVQPRRSRRIIQCEDDADADEVDSAELSRYDLRAAMQQRRLRAGQWGRQHPPAAVPEHPAQPASTGVCVVRAAAPPAASDQGEIKGPRPAQQQQQQSGGVSTEVMRAELARMQRTLIRAHQLLLAGDIITLEGLLEHAVHHAAPRSVL